VADRFTIFTGMAAPQGLADDLKKTLI